MPMPVDRDSEESSCPFCLDVVADTSQTMSQLSSPYDSLSVGFIVIGGSGHFAESHHAVTRMRCTYDPMNSECVC